MKKILPGFIFLFMLAAVAHAQITSTFDTDADGWIFLNASNVSLPGTFQSTNGNPGGYVSATYASNQNGSYQQWFAPAKFKGSQLARSLGMNLSFDLQQSQAGVAASGTGDVRIENGGSVIIYTLPTKPAVAPAWSSYTIKLDETSDWRWGTPAGAVATRQQIIGILSNVTSLEIRGTYATNATYTSGLDNVILDQRPIVAAPIITSFSQSSANPGTTITINGTGFDPTPANNMVYFESVAATINSATATQLSVVVPVGATYGPVTIINKTTGLVSRSAKPFNPTFAKGGRIIPESFAPKIDIALDPTAGNHVNGLVCADMDGDGWNDIIVAEAALNDISIFRNLGQGGSISASSFASKFSVDGAGNSGGITMIDLDGDGKLDIAASNTAGSNCRFATFRNISTPGNLAFEPVEIWPGLTYSGFTSRVIDLDGDGRAELLGQHGSSSIFTDFWIAQNISTPGNIEFGSSIDFTFGNSIDAGAGVGAGDLDNDGKPELLVSDAFGARFHILKNNSTPGTISFSQLGIINTGQYNNSMQVADLNLDGKNDLVWKMTGGSIRIRLNTNTGGPLSVDDFPAEIVLTSELGAGGGMTINDINGDGKPDLICSDNADIGVYENQYSGGVFDASAFIPAYQVSGVGSSASTAFASDLNGDHKPDLIFGATPTRLSIFENKNIHAPVISINTVSPLKGDVGSTVTITGNNFSTVPSENKVFFGGVEATVLTATENLITVEVPAGAMYAPVSVIKNGLTSRYCLPFQLTFGPGVDFDNTHFAPPINFTLTGANYDLDIGDLNRDGKPDIIAEGTGTNTYAFKNVHTTGSITTTSLIADDTTASASNPRIEDFDGDGYLDLMSVNGTLRRNTSTPGEISFLPTVTVPLGASMIDFADFNNDGKTDMTLTADLSGPGDLIILENRSANVTGNFISGTYASFSTNIIYTKPSPGGAVITGDFDGDGFADIVTTNPGTDNISIYRNLGLPKISTAQFATRVDVAVGDYPYYIYKGDFDSDGKLDLMLTHWTGTTTTLLIVLHNTSTSGNISFSRIDLTNPSAATIAHIADLDGDGRPEILTTSESGNRFSIFKNIHTGGALTAASFAAPFNVTVTAPRGITTGDLNLDGKPEIIITRAAGLLVVYENLISSGPTISINPQPTSTAVCNGDNTSFTLTASGADNLTYQWQKFDGSVFNNVTNGGGYSGATTATLGINTTGNFGAGDYRCLIKGDLATDVFSETVTLTVNAVPAAPTANGNSNCVPAAITLTASGGSNGQYRWYDANGVIIAAQVNSTYVTPVISTTTNYSVAINNGSCESTKTTVTATIQPLAKPTLNSSVPAVGGIINICTGDILTITAPSGFTTYTWSNGASTNPVTITATTTALTLQVANGGCTSPLSDPLNVIVNSYPVATITPSGTQLTASSGDTYQWYQNGEEVDGATNQKFEFNALEYGVYTVDVTDNGCTSTSDKFTYLITGFEKNTEGLKVYPNPVDEDLHIEFNPPYQIQVIGVSGKVVYDYNAESMSSSFDLRSLAKGVYVLKITTKTQTQFLRIIKK